MNGVNYVLFFLVATENPICIGGMPCQLISFHGDEPELVTVTVIGCIGSKCLEATLTSLRSLRADALNVRALTYIISILSIVLVEDPDGLREHA